MAGWRSWQRALGLSTEFRLLRSATGMKRPEFTDTASAAVPNIATKSIVFGNGQRSHAVPDRPATFLCKSSPVVRRLCLLRSPAWPWENLHASQTPPKALPFPNRMPYIYYSDILSTLLYTWWYALINKNGSAYNKYLLRACFLIETGSCTHNLTRQTMFSDPTSIH